MDRKPKPKNEGIFAHGLGIQVVLQGIMFAALSLIAYKLGESALGEAGGQTMAFAVLSMSQVVQAFNMRSGQSLFKIGFFTNRTLNRAVLLTVALTALVLFTPVRVIFGLVALPVQLCLSALGLILVPLVVMELSKCFKLVRH